MPRTVITTILCPIDFSDTSQRALAYAAALAGWYEATLTVFHVVPSFDVALATSARLRDHAAIVEPITRERIVDALRRSLETTGTAELPATLAVEEGDAVTAILEKAAAIRADLLVIGTHGRAGVDRLLLGSVTEKVLHRAPCPVLTVPPHAPAEPPRQVAFKRILCPIDFSPSSVKALTVALALAKETNGSITVLHVVEWLAGEEPRAQAHFNVPEFRRHLIADARERLHALIADEPRTWCDIDEVVTVGRSYREILDTAKAKGTELIVMGAQGRGGVDLMLFGSTTHHVVRGAPCPVLTLRVQPGETLTNSSNQ